MSLLTTAISEELGSAPADAGLASSSGSSRPSQLKKTRERSKIIAACTGAVVTSLTMTPFDVIKTRLQTQAPPPAAYHSALGQIPRGSTSPWPPPIASTSTSTISSSASPNPSPPSSSSRAQTFFLHNGADGSAPRPSPLPSSASNVYGTGSTASVALPNLQSTARARHLSGFWDAVSQIVRHEGPLAMWRGTVPALVMSIPGQVIYMVGYDFGRRTAFEKAPQWAYLPTRVGEDPTLPGTLRAGYLTAVPLVAGSFSRTVVACLASPLELVRTRLQASTSSTTLTQVLQSIRDDGGWRSAWRGLPPTLWRDVPFSGIYWAGYEAIKRSMTGGKGMGDRWEGQNASNEFLVAFVSGAGSGMIAATATNPFDVVKTRRQAQMSGSTVEGGAKEMTKTFEILLDIARREGLAGLMSGLTPRLAKVGPACGLMIGVYEGFSRYLD